MTLAPVLRAIRIDATPQRAFDAFTTEIGAWWPLTTHSAFGSESGGLSFRDGKLVELATDGREAVWGEILSWTPPTGLSFTWHPGQPPLPASQVSIEFEPEDEGTRVVLRHTGWEAFGEQGLARRRGYVGPNAWGYVLDHYADLAEDPSDAPDLEALRAAYGAFFAEAEQGGFGAPEPGHWTAERVLAHVALNDAAMLALCQSIVHDQGPLHLTNAVCHDEAALDRWITSSGDLDGLIARGRGQAQQFMSILRRLSATQLAIPVHCTFQHEGQIVLDDEMEWASIAIGAQTHRHLPAHVEQLRKLRH